MADNIAFSELQLRSRVDAKTYQGRKNTLDVLHIERLMRMRFLVR